MRINGRRTVAAAMAGWLLLLCGCRADTIPEPTGGTTAAPTTAVTTVPTAALPVPAVEAEGVILYDQTADRLLYGKNADEVLYPASLTKLLTAVTALQYGGGELTYTVGSELSLLQAGSSTARLKKGQRLSFPMLLDALLMVSGNDAAYVMAVTVARHYTGKPALTDTAAVAVFMDLMNQCAWEIGAIHGHFTTPDGYQDPRHYTTASDLLRITRRALTHDSIRASVAKASADFTLLSGESVSYQTTNLLLRADSPYYRPGCTGLKTGSTNEAGYCLAAMAEQDGRELIVLLLRDTTKEQRFADANLLLDYGFSFG